MLTTLLLTLALSSPGPGPVQVQVQVQEPGQATSPVPGVFTALAQGEAVILAGTVKKHSKSGSGMRGVMILGGPGGSSKRYEGGFEASVESSGRRLVTGDSFPGFGLYSGERGKLVQTFYSEDPIDVTALDRELGALLDFASLARHSARVEWKIERDPDTATATVTGDLPGALVPKPAGPGGPREVRMKFEPAVLRVGAELTLEEGRLRSARYTVVYSDPMAAMRDLRGSGGGPGGSFRLEGGELDDVEPVEGDVIEYRMVYRRGKLSKALRNWEQMSAILLQARDTK